MKNLRIRLIALVVALAVLLTGCYDMGDYMRLLRTYLTGTVPVVAFDDMEYHRPDVDAFLEYQTACAELAQDGEDFEALEENVWLLYESYYDFYTMHALADIHYCQDMADLYWEEEYAWCMEAAADVDAGMDQLFYVLAESEFREALEREDLFGEGFFDAYMGESVWDETFTQLMEEEAVLVGAYYDLTENLMETEYGSMEYAAAAMELANLYARLIALRQEQALHSGYANFHNFAYEFYYGRDYTPEQEAVYLAAIRDELVPLYRRVCTNGVVGIDYGEVTEEDTFAYVQEAARNMGGRVEEAFNVMKRGKLYDISYSQNKYPSSFEVFLLNYYEPFIFMCPTMTSYDKLAFAHEFGHFCNDHASWGSMLSTDGAEVYSQGMEYLSLQYVEDTGGLARLKMMDSLCTYVEQAAYAAFEHEAYNLYGDELTGANLITLFEEVTSEYGFDLWESDGTDFVTVPHFFTNPMYVFSYVVSNDAAMQLYQMELAESGAGLAVYEGNMDSAEYGFLAFLASAGLESPFDEGRLEMVRETFEGILE
ncbi:MAG: hypothetical protein IJZ39_02955 [Oscillospiraceae bacterium]|nr:hypothetical protein [Oscillospiraceae bacterium]